MAQETVRVKKSSRSKKEKRYWKTAAELKKEGLETVRIEVQISAVERINEAAQVLSGYEKMKPRLLHTIIFDKLGNHPELTDLLAKILA